MFGLQNTVNSHEDMCYRTRHLTKLGEMILNDQIISKVDLIGSVSLTNGTYYNVYRRYNSYYDIIIEDVNLNYLIQADMTIRESIGSAIKLSETEINSMYSVSAMSFKHNITINDSECIMDKKWSDIQTMFTGINVIIYYKQDEVYSQVNDVFNYDISDLTNINNSVEVKVETGQETEQDMSNVKCGKKRTRSNIPDFVEQDPVFSEGYNLRNKKPRI
jgi:hypothetical protein